MIQRIFLFCILNAIFALSFADVIFNAYQNAVKISQEKLPPPYDHLLTQPLMTKALATYYQCRPRIEILSVEKNHSDNTYHRVIRMLADRNKAKNETMVLELAFITINFNALPKKVIDDVQNTNIPFGQLLLDSKIKITNQDRSYFILQCSKELAVLAHCPLDSRLYGRTNTIIRADNHQWLARVVEILF